MKPYDKKIILENGMEFYGYGFGSNKQAINEIVFNTSMVIRKLFPTRHIQTKWFV